MVLCTHSHLWTHLPLTGGLYANTVLLLTSICPAIDVSLGIYVNPHEYLSPGAQSPVQKLDMWLM